MKNIDDLFRQGLGGYTEVPPPNVWDALEERLDNDRNKRPALLYRRLWLVALLFCVGIFTTLFALKFNGSQPSVTSTVTMPVSAVPGTMALAERNAVSSPNLQPHSSSATADPKQRRRSKQKNTDIASTAATTALKTNVPDKTNEIAGQQPSNNTQEPIASAKENGQHVADAPSENKVVTYVTYVKKQSNTHNISVSESEPLSTTIAVTGSEEDEAYDEEENTTFSSSSAIASTDRKAVYRRAVRIARTAAIAEKAITNSRDNTNSGNNTFAQAPTTPTEKNSKSSNRVATLATRPSDKETPKATSNNCSKTNFDNGNSKLATTTTPVKASESAGNTVTLSTKSVTRVNNIKKHTPTVSNENAKGMQVATSVTTARKADDAKITAANTISSKPNGNSPIHSNNTATTIGQNTQASGTSAPLIALASGTNKIKLAKNISKKTSASIVPKLHTLAEVSGTVAIVKTAKKHSLASQPSVRAIKPVVTPVVANNPKIAFTKVTRRKAIALVSITQKLNPTKISPVKGDAITTVGNATTNSTKKTKKRVSIGNTAIPTISVASIPTSPASKKTVPAVARSVKQFGKADLSPNKPLTAASAPLPTVYAATAKPAGKAVIKTTVASPKLASVIPQAHKTVISKASKKGTSSVNTVLAARQNKPAQKAKNPVKAPVAKSKILLPTASVSEAEDFNIFSAVSKTAPAPKPVPKAAAVVRHDTALAKADTASKGAATADTAATASGFRFLKGFEIGIKGGYERSIGNAGVDKYVIAPYIERKLNSRLSLVLQPTLKFSNLRTQNLDGQQSFYEEKDSSSSFTKDPIYILPGQDTAWMYHVHLSSTYRNTVKNYVAGGRYVELEIPLMLKYKLTSHLSVMGGVNVGYSKFIAVTELNKYTFNTHDTTIDLPFSPNVVISSLIKPQGSAITNYTSPLYPTPQGSRISLGYMFGVSYEIRKRWMVDMMIQQSKINKNVVGGYDLNKAFSTPYMRFTIGYRLY